MLPCSDRMKIVLFLSLVGCVSVANGFDKESEIKSARATDNHHARKPIFRDDFNTLDLNQWVPDVRLAQGLKNQFQIYSPDKQNCYAHGGLLYLRPTLTSDTFGEHFLQHGTLDVKHQWGACRPPYKNACNWNANTEGMMPPLMSCHLRSNFTFKYGKLEIIAQMPRGDWLWPGLWLLPRHFPYGGWPRSGEIDIAETSGNINFDKFGVQRATASLIFGESNEAKKHLLGQTWLHGSTYADAMHNYTMDWTPSHINLYVDGALVNGVPTPKDGMHAHYNLPGANIWSNSANAPFDQEFYIILSLATGGTMFSDKATNFPHAKPWKSTDASSVAMEKFWNHKNDWYSTWHGDGAAMKVDSVTVWSHE